jgi:hypothetical protein
MRSSGVQTGANDALERFIRGEIADTSGRAAESDSP